MYDLSADLWSVLIAVEKRVIPPNPALIVEHGFAEVGRAEEAFDFGPGLASHQVPELVIGLLGSWRGTAGHERQEKNQKEEFQNS